MINKRKRIITLFFSLTALISISCKTAEFGYKVIDISGMVYDFTNRPIAHCDISLRNKYKASTDINGRFTLLRVPAGKYMLAAYKRGYEKYQEEVNINDRGQIIYFRMPSQGQLLDLVDTAMAANDFTSAEEFVERAYRIDENNIEMLFYYATIKFRQNDYEKAIGFLEAARDLGSRDVYIDRFMKILRGLQNVEISD